MNWLKYFNIDILQWNRIKNQVAIEFIWGFLWGTSDIEPIGFLSEEYINQLIKDNYDMHSRIN